MELRQVRYFAAVARSRSFGAAADDLHVAKSAVSTQIKQLEEELGTQLLVRGGGRRDVRLTAAGEAFFEEAQAILRSVDDAAERVRDLADVSSGTCRVVVQRGWETWEGWEAMLTEFRRRHPAMALKLTQGESYDAMLSGVADAQVDLAVLGITDREVLSAPGVRIERLHSEPVVVALSPGHRFAGRERVALDELRDENWVLAPLEHAILANVTRTHDFVPRVEVEPLTQAMVRTLILTTGGVTITSPSEAAFYAPATTVPLCEPELTSSVAVAYREARPGASARLLRDYFRELFAAV